MGPEYANYEYHKLQFMGTLQGVSQQLRDCAQAAEQFAQLLAAMPYNASAPPPFPLANGQFPMGVAPQVSMMQDETGKKRKSRSDDPDGKRKAKKIKDPNAPKRPPSSYLLFQNDVRNELKAKNPGLSNNELLGAISKLWAEMPQEQKDAYEARNKIAKDHWLAQKAIYEGKHVGPSADTPPMAALVPPVAKPEPVIAPVVATPAPAESSSEETSAAEEDDEEESDSEEEVPAPPPKKSKKEAAAPAAKEEGKKEKKHKKSKA